MSINRAPISGFDSLIGQEKPVRLIRAALKKNSLPHALLFTGKPGVGKTTAAVNIAMTLNCRAQDFSGSEVGEGPGEACGNCRSCRKIISGNHPDIIRIKPSGAYIRIDQIRELCRSIALKPYEATVRLVLLPEAHLMNAEAGNALLKILEEPPGNTIFILTAPETGDLMPTIVSRCQQIRFRPVPRDQMERWLKQYCGMDTENAMIISSLADGSIGRALNLRDTDWVSRRNRIIDEIENIGGKPPGHVLHFSETLAQDKDNLPYAFEIMKNWFRDLAVARCCPEKIINQDLQERISLASRVFGMEQILEKENIIGECERAISGNANMRLALDAMVLQLAN